MTMTGKQAPYLDGVPVVASTTERNTRFPSPDTNQRVHNLGTGAIERWNGAAWATDLPGAVSPTRLAITDGTTPSTFDLAATSKLGTSVVVNSANASGAYIGAHVEIQQSVATTGSVQGTEGYAVTAHPSGTVTLALGAIGNIEHAGAGTLTTAKGVGGGVVLSGSGTITDAHCFDVAGGNRKLGGATGTMTNYVGYYCGDLSTSGATNNYPVDCANAIRADYSATAGDTRFLLWDVTAGTLKRVSIGAADSGGAGFKVLRVPN